MRTVVSRLHCVSDTYEAELTLDINSEIYSIKRGDRFNFALTTSLDGAREKAEYDPKPGVPSFMDRFDYVMNGKVFKIQEDGKTTNKMSVSEYFLFSVSVLHLLILALLLPLLEV